MEITSPPELLPLALDLDLINTGMAKTLDYGDEVHFASRGRHESWAGCYGLDITECVLQKFIS